MEIEDLLTFENVVACHKASSKKQVIQSLSQNLSRQMDLDERQVFLALMDRERLGSTGVGKGVAIPHARVPGISGIVGLFAHLATPIDFDSVDDRQVDLVFMLLAPEQAGADHLKALARVSRLLRDEKMCEKLRATHEQQALYAMLVHPSSNAA